MKKILLVDADSAIPNIALMKLSACHKLLGDTVELIKLQISYYPDRRKQKIVDADKYDKVYVSIIFPGINEFVKIINCDNIEFGGTGYDIKKKLPKHIDDIKEDYSIYKETDNSYGFITRGCIRNCSFCFVPKKEGLIYKYRTVDEIVVNKNVYILDNNIMAHHDREKIFQEIVDKKIRCQFNQGLDMRLMTDRLAILLSKMKYIGEYFFAFDNINLESILQEKLDLFKKYIGKPWKTKFFIYCNAEMELSDPIYRVEWCRKNYALPYFMRDINCWSSVNRDFYTDMAAYCNQPNIFKKMSFKEYIYKRHPKNIGRADKSLNLYNKNYENNINL